MWNQILYFNLDGPESSSVPLSIETFKKSILDSKRLHPGVTYYLYVLDTNFKVHGSLIKFKVENYSENDELIIDLYEKVHKRIYNLKGNQIKTWEKYRKDYFGNMKYNNIVIMMIELSPSDKMKIINKYFFIFYLTKLYYFLIHLIKCKLFYIKYRDCFFKVINSEIWFYLLISIFFLTYYAIYIKEGNINIITQDNINGTINLEYNILKNFAKIKYSSPILYKNYIMAYKKLSWVNSYHKFSKFSSLFILDRNKIFDKQYFILSRYRYIQGKNRYSIGERAYRIVNINYMSNVLYYLIHRDN